MNRYIFEKLYIFEKHLLENSFTYMSPKKKIETGPFETIADYRKAFNEQVDEQGNKVRPTVTFYVRRPDGAVPESGPSIMWKFGSGLTDGPNPMSWNQRP